MITTINKQTSNTKKLSNFRISIYSAGITTPDKKTVEIIYNSYGVPNLSAVDLGLHGDRNVTLLKLNFKDLLWNTADITNYQISLFVDGSKVDSSFEMDNTNPIIIYPIDTTSLKVGTHEFVVSIMEKSKTSGSNIDMGQEVYLCRAFKGIINASDFSEPVNSFDFAGISNKGLRRHQIEVMLADDGQFALKQAITSEEQFSTDLGIQYDRFVSYICFNESTDITGKVTNLDKYIVFQNLTSDINYYVKLNTTSGHQHGTENTLTAWVPPQVTEVAGAWTIYFVGKNEDESIRFVSRSISLSVLPTTIPYDEVNPEHGINIPVTFKLSFYYVSTSTKVAEAYAILRNASLNALKKITDTEQTIDLRQGEQYILELHPEGEWSYQGDKVIPESRVVYTVPKNATADTFVGAYELTAEPPIRELMITPTEEEQVFEEEGVDGYKPVIVKSIQALSETVDLTFADSNQVITPYSGTYIKQVTINKPETLIPTNIKSGVNIAGITGTYEFKTQNKTFTPTQTGGSVSADSSYDGLGLVTVNPVPLGNKTDVPLNFYNQTAGTIADSQSIYSDENKFMTWASVTRPSTLIAENIKKDINIAGITGTLESGGASLNIAYGDTAPSDTSKLWIKGSEPEGLLVSTKQMLTTLSTTLPTGANHIGTAAVGTKIYLFGGYTGSRLSTIQVFDTTNNTLSTLSTKLPSGAYGIGTAVVGTKIYLFGGRSIGYLSTIQVFDTTNNTLSTLSTKLPSSAYGIGTAAVGTKIYLFGGDTGSPLKTIQVFDTTNDTITTLSATLPLAAYGIGTAAVGTKIYLFGGNGSGYGRLDTIQVFDTTNNTITTLSTTLSTVADSIGTAAVDTKIYLFGGLGSSRLNTIQVFDTTNNTILTLSITLPTGTNGIGTAAVGTKIYLFGGYSDAGYLNTINEFLVQFSLTANSILITEGQQENVFNLLSSPTQVEISVKNVYRGDSSNVAQLNDTYLHNGTNWVNVNTGAIWYPGYNLTITADGISWGGSAVIINSNGETETVIVNNTSANNNTPQERMNIVSIQSITYVGHEGQYYTINGKRNIPLPYLLQGNTILDIYSNGCFIEGTPITLANHTYKNVEDITYNDNLLVWDFDKGEFSQAKSLWIMKQKQAIKYNHLVFSDNSELNTVEQHRIFNIEKGMFTYPMTEDTPIGTHTLNDKGEIVELVSKEVVEKEVNYYNIITNYHINLFAGHILTSCRLSNIYPIKDFKYVKDNREIIPFEKFDVPKEYYDGLRLGEQPTNINRDNAVQFGDNSVEDYVKRLIRSKK